MAVNKGHRGQSIGRCGVSHGLLVSALQKYIRRGEEAKALRCAVELDRFSELGKEGEPIRSNMINRIAIIAMEDVGPADPETVRYVGVLCGFWTRERERDGRSYLLTAVRILARSPKSRLTSHARAAYSGSPEALSLMQKYGLAVPQNHPLLDPFHKEEKGTATHRLQSNLVQCLKAASDEAVWWVNRLLESTQSRGIAYMRRRGEWAAVWECIDFVSRTVRMEHSPFKKPVGPAQSSFAVSQALWCLREQHHSYKNAREAQCFAVCAALILVRFVRGAYRNVRQPEYKEIEVNTKEVESLYATCPKLVIDDYAVDKHTAEGRLLGKDTAEFVHVGSVVTNQAAHAWEPVWYAIYRDLRVPPSEAATYRDPVRCQLVTGEGKTCSYLALCGNARVFVKGPMAREAAALQVQLDAVKGFLFGLKPIGLTVRRHTADLFPNTPLGRRKKYTGQPAHFIVGPDLFHMDGADKVSTKEMKSKVWPLTAVYDRAADAKATARHVALRTEVTEGILLALAFRYVFGVGDTCDRNMLVTPDGVAYSLDEETALREYAKPRFGATVRAAIVERARALWDGVSDCVACWPDEIEAAIETGADTGSPWLTHDDMKKLLEFIRPRIEDLLNTGPEALY